jgi:hypothetical protein
MAVYPYVTLWQLPQTYTSESHPHLIGSMRPVVPDYGLIAERLSRPAIKSDIARLHDAGFSRAAEFISQLAMDQDGLADLLASVGPARLNTDDLPCVEFYARPPNVQMASKITQIGLFQAIEKRMRNPFDMVQDIPDADKAGLSKELERLLRGDRALIRGHAFYVARLNLQPDPEMLSNFNYLVIRNYSEAYRLIPESSYLKDFFEKNRITPM